MHSWKKGIAAVLLTFFGLYAYGQTPITISGEIIGETLVSAWQQHWPHSEDNHSVTWQPTAQHVDVHLTLHPDENTHFTYFSVAQFHLVPVLNNAAASADGLISKGLNRNELKQLFFEDPYSEVTTSSLRRELTVYSRLGQHGISAQFAAHFGYKPENIRGKAIAGNDKHVLMAMLRDATAISYSALPIVYQPESGKIKEGLTVVPVDLDGNRKVSDWERDYADLLSALGLLTAHPSDNIPTVTVYLGVDLNQAQPSTLQFIKWVLTEGQTHLNALGFLAPDDKNQAKALGKLNSLAANQP